MCGVPQPSEHFEFTLQDCGSGRELQSAAWGAPHFSPRPRPGGGKASEGAAGLDRFQAELRTPSQHISRERHFYCPGPHGTSADVASRNLRNTSNSHFKTAAVGRSCNVRRGARHIFLRDPGRAGGRQAKTLLGWIASSMTKANTSPKDFPRRAFRLSRATRNCCTCGVPQPSKHFQFTVHTSRLRQQAEAAKGGVGVPMFFPEPGAERGNASEGAAGLDRILQAELHHLANTIPAKSISAVQGHTEILHWWRPATFGTL
jgi:hypothetical protein